MTKGNALSVVLYDTSGAPLDPRAVEELIAKAEALALTFKLVVNVVHE